MYKCEACGNQTKPRTPCHVVPVEMREKVYPPRQGDPGGRGYEIVREKRVCPSCVDAVSLQ